MDKGCNPKPWHKEVGHRLRPLTWMNPADGIAATEMILLTSIGQSELHMSRLLMEVVIGKLLAILLVFSTHIV